MHTLRATFVRLLHGKGDVVPRARTWRVAADGGYGRVGALSPNVRRRNEKSRQNETTGDIARWAREFLIVPNSGINRLRTRRRANTVQ
jgi:hypothetical protein